MSVSYVTCICTGDGKWLPSTCTNANNNLLYIDDKAATVEGAEWDKQQDVTTLVYDHYNRVVDQGSSLVWVDDKRLSRVGDTITNQAACTGSAIAEGSELVFAD
jgi:uncharacterized Zn-binding protein involved in type VI secretion